MTQALLHRQAKPYLRSVPDLRAGYTVRVHQRVQEGDKERTQVFEGLVIGVRRGASPTDASFTVRRMVEGVGVERVFPLHSPVIKKIEVKKVARVRRAKLNFLRGRQGKAARLSERFTTAGEFAAASVENEKGTEKNTEAAATA
jgi:large subunit ribosomal protein L19